MYSLIIYDTSNYVDFPIGGQLTSIRNFLTYIARYHKDFCREILLVGLTTNYLVLGKKSKVQIESEAFDFFPVVYRNTNLNEVKNSLRLEFLKGLFKFRNDISNDKRTIHYIHTPEAFIQVKLCHPSAKTVFFSHGNIFSMTKTFRFYKGNRGINFCFNIFIKWILRAANMIFVLDESSLNAYQKYNKNVIKVNNSIVLPEGDYSRKNIHDPVRLLFVGRLSKVKGIENIIKAIDNYQKDVSLTIVGDGEEAENLKSLVASDRISFRGALKPNQVKDEMMQSDILIMNSIVEGKPMTIIEAMSYAMPIITTDVGGISELVEFGGNAVKTDGTVKQIQTAIKNIIEKYPMYSKRSYCLSTKFDYKIVNKEVFSVINKYMM